MVSGMAIDVVIGACDPGEESDVQGVALILSVLCAGFIMANTTLTVWVIARKTLQSERAAVA